MKIWPNCYYKFTFLAALVDIENGRATIFGVTSWSLACGYAEYPDVFGRVSKVRDWIEMFARVYIPLSYKVY